MKHQTLISFITIQAFVCTSTLLSVEPATVGAPKPVIGSYGATLAPKIPAGAIVVPAERGTLAKATSSHSTDTVFYLKAGVHTGNGEMRPKAGSVFIGEAGAILDGENATAKCFIHDSGVIPYAASAPRYVVTLRNLVIRNYCSADQQCVVMAPDTGQGWTRAPADPADRNGWLIEHCTFTSNRAGGAYLGSASTARNCLFSNNGQVGVKACGRNVRLLDCRSTRNNVDRKFNYMWEAGGTKFWGVKDMLVDGGEYDHNGGFGLWFDYVWDGNVVKNASFHHNLRPGLSIEMAAGVEVTGCTFSSDDLDGLSGEIPAAFRPWDKSPKSGPDLWSGEIMLFNACAAGTYIDPATKVSYSNGTVMFFSLLAHRISLRKAIYFFEPNVNHSNPPWPKLYITSLALLGNLSQRGLQWLRVYSNPSKTTI
jgi:hypothetical protein